MDTHEGRVLFRGLYAVQGGYLLFRRVIWIFRRVIWMFWRVA